VSEDFAEQARKLVATWPPPTEEVNRALTTLAIKHSMREKEREQQAS
jgi:hypothetical protein